MTRIALATVFATAIAGYGVAHAQDDDDAFDDGGGGDMGGGDTGGGDMGGGDDSGGADMGGGAAASGGPTMGISTAFPTGGDGTAANILWGLGGENWLDLRLGVNFTKGEDPVSMESSSVFGVDLGVGYRMYKPVKGKIRPYMEPAVFFGVDDFSAAGDTIFLALAALMGVDYALMDQFTLGVGVGAGLSFTDKFKTIDFGLFTTSINATFWW